MEIFKVMIDLPKHFYDKSFSEEHKKQSLCQKLIDEKNEWNFRMP
jgi:hypothetical protein